MKINKLPPLEFLKECFEITDEFESGLKWKIRPEHHYKNTHTAKGCNIRYANKMAGANINGYYTIGTTINGKLVRILVHRIVYALHNNTQDLENYLIDHIDRDKLNNKPANLRRVSHSENAINSGLSSKNTSGTKGVFWCRFQKRWVSTIHRNGATIRLGSYKSKNDAISARKIAEYKL